MMDGYKIGYWRFSAWFLGLSIALPMASVALKYATGIELGQVGATIVPMMIAAMQEGVHFARATKRLPSGKERLVIARMLTCIAVAWTSVLAFVGVMLATGPSLFSIVSPAVIVGIALFLIALFFALGWLFFGMGAKNEMKLITKATVKDFE